MQVLSHNHRWPMHQSMSLRWLLHQSMSLPPRGEPGERNATVLLKCSARGGRRRQLQKAGASSPCSSQGRGAWLWRKSGRRARTRSTTLCRLTLQTLSWKNGRRSSWPFLNRLRSSRSMESCSAPRHQPARNLSCLRSLQRRAQRVIYAARHVVKSFAYQSAQVAIDFISQEGVSTFATCFKCQKSDVSAFLASLSMNNGQPMVLNITP